MDLYANVVRRMDSVLEAYLGQDGGPLEPDDIPKTNSPVWILGKRYNAIQGGLNNHLSNDGNMNSVMFFFLLSIRLLLFLICNCACVCGVCVCSRVAGANAFSASACVCVYVCVGCFSSLSLLYFFFY